MRQELMCRRFSTGIMRAAVGLTVIAAGLGLVGCSDASKIEALTRRLDEMQARVQRLDDVKEIEKLTRTYGYYIDKGMWSEVVELFAEDSAVQLGAGQSHAGGRGRDVNR